MVIFLGILAGILVLLAIFLLVPARVRLRYDDDLTVWVGVGPVTLRVWPQKKKPKRKRARAKRGRAKGASQKPAVPQNLRPRLTLEALTAYAALGRQALGRALCTVRIRRLRLRAVVAARDPGQAALAYGGAAAALAAVLPGLEGIINWRQTDILVEAGFSGEARVAVDTIITIVPIVALAAAVRGFFGYIKINEQADQKAATDASRRQKI